MSDDDPLEGVDIFDSRTVERTKRIHTVDIEPIELYGFDRQVEIQNVDVDVIETEGEAPEIEIVWEAELTKCLPPRWDQANEPRTEEERKAARRKRWTKRLAHAASLVIPFGLVAAVGFHVMQAASNQITINGEPLVAPSGGVWLTTVSIVFIIALIAWGVRGGFPGRVA